MSLATTDDVRRYVPDDAADAALSAMLESAEAWAKRVCGRAWDAEGEVVEHFYTVRDGEILTLRDENPSGVVVTAYGAHGSDGEVLTEDSGYHVREGGKVELVFVRYASPAGLPGAVVEVRPFTWARVEVAYTASGVVPSPVREAVAMIAACMYLDTQSAGSLLSERMGDYSYSREPEGQRVPIPNRASALLRPYNRRLRARST